MADIAEVLKRAKPPERFVDVCLDRSLTARHADLQRQLEDPATVADGADKRRKIADDIHKIEGQIRAETVRFHLRGTVGVRAGRVAGRQPAPRGQAGGCGTRPRARRPWCDVLPGSADDRRAGRGAAQDSRWRLGRTREGGLGGVD
jgi:hypothetical protein